MLSYPRDLSGYGANPPPADWPGGARIAVQFVLNEGRGENCILHGDQASACAAERSKGQKMADSAAFRARTDGGCDRD